jgi:transcriptional regulator with XRE-family HTH domain
MNDQAEIDSPIRATFYSIGKYLKRQRKRGQRRQRDIAAKIGVSPATISNIETGKRKVSPRTVDLYVNYFDIPKAKLFSDIYNLLSEYVH